MKAKLCTHQGGFGKGMPGIRLFYRAGIFLFLFTLSFTLHAQLVADGQTNFLDGVTTNITNGITVGSSGSFTLLVITNGAVLTNSGGADSIGLNASAQSNRVVVTGAGSSWNCPTVTFITGQGGSGSELDLQNGGTLSSVGATIGYSGGSSNNLVVISDAGSAWTNTGEITLGANGSFNTIILTNGGLINSGIVDLGSSFGTNNSAWVTGPASTWINSGISVGGYSSGNSLVVTNGGKVVSSGSSEIGAGSFDSGCMAVVTGSNSSWAIGGYFYLGTQSLGRHQLLVNQSGVVNLQNTCDIGAYANSNLLTVADANSSLQCQNYRMGYSSIANQCVVSNGASLGVTVGASATVVEGTFTHAIITGAGSIWTNAGDFQFGQYSNTLSITSGGVLEDNNGYVESGYGKPNLVVISGANSAWNNLQNFQTLDLGSQLLITNGGTLADVNGYLGYTSGSNCYALVSGAGSLWTNRTGLYVGYSGLNNQLVVANSGTVSAPSLYIGYTGNSNQLVVSNSGVVTVGNTLQIGNASDSGNNLIVNGGTIIVTNTLALNLYSTLTLTSGSLKAGILSASGAGSAVKLNFNGGNLILGSTYYSSSLPFVVGNSTNPAVLQLTNGGINGTHYYSSGLVISSNALFTGVGIISGNVTIGNGGTYLQAAANPVFFTMSNALVFSAGSTNIMGLFPSAADNDYVQSLTNVVFGGTLQLTNLGGTYRAGQSYQLFRSAQYSGAYSAIIPAAPGLGLRWDTSELTVDGTLRIVATPTPPPTISSSISTGGRLIIRGIGGTPYDPCYLLTATNLVPPVWSYLTTNYFDATGTVNFTNPVSLADAQRYFKLQVN